MKNAAFNYWHKIKFSVMFRYFETSLYALIILTLIVLVRLNA